MVCLDTNVIIGAINGRTPAIRTRLAEQMSLGADIVIPVIALYEMRYGCAKSDRREQSERLIEVFLASGIRVLAFEPEDADHAGDIRAILETKGTPIGPYDVLIAAQARRRGAVLVTTNRREFDRVPGLIVTSWVA